MSTRAGSAPARAARRPRARRGGTGRQRIVMYLLAVASVGGCAALSGCAVLRHAAPPGVATASPAASKAAPAVARARLSARPDSYLGVFEPGAPTSYDPVEAFARATKRQPNIALYYSDWRAPFRASFAAAARSHGAVPLVQLQPINVNMAAIAAGKYDRYLKSYADAVRAFGHAVIIGFAHEMNGSWYSWGTGHVSAATWVAAWRRVVTVFRQQGARNVTWLWTIHHTADASALSAYWPGRRFVTWVGIDGYLETPTNTFQNVFGSSVQAVREITSKPILLSETAAGPDTGRQAQDITSLFAGIRSEQLLGIVWFDADQNGGVHHQDWRLEGNPAALTAFRDALRTYR
jgi:mannan endo-1,4-beta-mannosidase